VAVAMQHIQDPPPPIAEFAPETPPAVVAVVMRALEKDARNRFRSAREMAEALMKAKDGKLDPASIMPEPIRIPVPPQPRVKEMSPRIVQGPQRPGVSARRNALRKRRRLAGVIATSLLAAAVLTLLTLGIVQIVTQASRSALAPDVVSLTVEDALEMAKREELNWQQTDVYHDTIPAGQVISQILEADTPMEKGDSLLVTVSLGPASTAMPDVRGLGYEDAADRLKQRGFGGTIAIKTVSTSPTGTVLEQNPKANDPFTPGQSVELTISGGSVMVPEVVGFDREEAISLLLASNLSEASATFIKTTDPEQVGKVLAQNPAAGTMMALGSPVTLSIGIESQPYQGSLALTVPASEQEHILRVMLVIDGREITKYEGTLAPGEERGMTIPINANTAGEVTCAIYLDDELYSTEYVTLY